MSLDTILMLTSALLLGVLMVVFYLAWRQQSHAQRSELPGQASISRSKEVMLILGFIANSCAFRGQAHKAVLRRIVDSSVAQSGVGSAAEQRARQALNLAFIRGFLEYKTQESIVPELHKLRDSNLSEQGRARDLTCTRMLDLILCEGQLSQEAKLRYLLVGRELGISYIDLSSRLNARLEKLGIAPVGGEPVEPAGDEPAGDVPAGDRERP